MPAARERPEGLGGLVGALPLLDERRRHILDAEPERAAARLADERQVFLHLQRVVDRHLREPADAAAQSLALEFRAGQLSRRCRACAPCR